MNKTASLALIAWILLLPICGAGTLKPETIPSFKLDPAVVGPVGAYFHGGAYNLRSMGFVGAAIADRDLGPGAQLTEFLKAQNINFPQIMMAAIDSRLRAGSLATKLSETSENTLRLTIEGYGLGKGAGFAPNVRPSATVSLVLTDATGKKLWKNKAEVGGYDKQLPIKLMEEWMKDPKGLEAAFGDAAKLLAEKLLPLPR